MPSGWEVYYVVFLSALLALAVPASLGLVSSFVRSRSGPAKVPRDLPGDSLGARVPPRADDTALGRRVNTRFFLGANAALVLITLALVLVPCVGTLQAGGTRQGLLRGLISILSIAGFSALGLLYSARKGDLSWLSTHREDEPAGTDPGGKP